MESAYLPRHLDAALVQACESASLIILDGARGVGKTTTARRIAKSVVALPRDLEALKIDASAYLTALEPPVLIDEWQLAGSDLLWTLKDLVDNDPTPGRFLLAGSVEPASYGPTYPLTGRAVRLVMRPMSTSELAGRGAAEGFLSAAVRGFDSESSAGRTSGFDVSTMFVPGFPGARSMVDPQIFLDAYAMVITQRAGEEGRDASRLLRTMRVLATLSAQAAPDQRVWESADINKATYRSYDDLLTRAHLYVPSPALESNRLRRLTSYPKRFLADTAMALTLAETNEEELRADPQLAGRFVEAFVMQQLRPQVDILGGSLHHLRTGAGEREVDAIVAWGQRMIGIEVKLTTRPTSSDVRHLQWLADQLGERFVGGFLIHAGTDTFKLAANLWALPMGAL